MAVEFAPPGKRGLYGAFAPMGTLSATRWPAACSGSSARWRRIRLLTWGWRIPFLVSIVLLGLGVYIRAVLAKHRCSRRQRTRPPLSCPAIEAIRRTRATSSWWSARGWRKMRLVISIRCSASATSSTTCVCRAMSRSWASSLGNIALVFGHCGFAGPVGPHRTAPGLYFRRAVLGRLRFSFFLSGNLQPDLIMLAFMLEMGIGSARDVRAAGGLFRRIVRPAAALFRLCLRPRAGLHHRRGPVAADRRGMLVGWMSGAPWGVCLLRIWLSLVTTFAVWCGPETYKSDIRADSPEDRAADASVPVRIAPEGQDGATRVGGARRPPARSAATGRGSCPSSAALPASGRTVHSRRRR